MEMVKVTIDNKVVEIESTATILDAAKKAGVDIPTLCYFKELNEIGACRVCVVEVEGEDRLPAACNTTVRDGMVVHTNSPRVRKSRKINVELILSEHDCRCPTCVRSGNCKLQTIANELNVFDIPYKVKLEKGKATDFPLVRQNSKCIKCMRCIQVCDKIQGLGVWDLVSTGSRTTVGVRDGINLKENCSLCGQCITHCPVGALRERDDTDKVYEALADKKKVTVIQIAPAVRAAWAEDLGIPFEKATPKLMVAAVKALGFNYVFDTSFSADLTIMEEGSEFIERLTKGGKLPMFTSCCPGWVRFMKSEYPELTDNLSTAKSPQQMFGAVAKTYFADKIETEPKDIFCVSIMPCTAKKHEAGVDSFKNENGDPDVDVVLTTRELARMIKADRINVLELAEQEFDNPLGIGTGAGIIFGSTGGVMEAALRSAHFMVTGKNPDADAFKSVRGMNGWKESEIDINGITVKVAVASGLANTRRLIEAIKAGEVSYDFVEIMACPGGCAGGGGQPIRDGIEMAGERCSRLYAMDKMSTLRFSHENPSVQKLYEEYLEKPMSHTAHELLHTDLHQWKL